MCEQLDQDIAMQLDQDIARYGQFYNDNSLQCHSFTNDGLVNHMVHSDGEGKETKHTNH
jgi:hypothetical protein